MKYGLLLTALLCTPYCLAQGRPAPALEVTTLEAPKILETLAQQPSPEPFIQELYRELQQVPTPDAFSGGDGAARIYGKPLLSSVHKEFWGSRQSFAGQLDYAPLCVCRDPTSFALSPIVLTPVDKSHTDAVFTLHFEPRPAVDLALQAPASPTAFPESSEPAEPAQPRKPMSTPPDRRITLHLVHGEHGWRIDDIAVSDVPSMKFLLRQRNPDTAEEDAAAQTPQQP